MGGMGSWLPCLLEQPLGVETLPAPVRSSRLIFLKYEKIRPSFCLFHKHKNMKNTATKRIQQYDPRKTKIQNTKTDKNTKHTQTTPKSTNRQKTQQPKKTNETNIRPAKKLPNIPKKRSATRRRGYLLILRPDCLRFFCHNTKRQQSCEHVF